MTLRMQTGNLRYSLAGIVQQQFMDYLDDGTMSSVWIDIPTEEAPADPGENPPTQE